MEFSDLTKEAREAVQTVLHGLNGTIVEIKDGTMTPVEVAQNIEKFIMAIRSEGAFAKGLIEKVANANAEYDKEMGVQILKLKADGQPTTIVEKLAKANCSDLLINKITADETIKAHRNRLDYLKAQLNGYQSINRHLDSV